MGSRADDDTTADATELLRQLIRNQCVNDGRVQSGQETKNVALLGNYLEGAGLDLERYEPQPGRASLVARIEGSDPQAPSLLLMGHTDVVPVNPDGWSRDPFGAEIVDGFVWGRGAVDMLNETATMALAFRRLADSGFKPRGTLIYLAVADEEALGTWGAKWLVENERDAVYADYVLTESGGFRIPTAGGTRLPVMVDEKGTYWSKLTVRGTPGHASQPFRTDNAVVTAAEVVRRLHEYRPPTRIHDTWRRFVEGMNYPPEFRDALLKDEELRDFAGTLPLGLSRVVYSCTHTTFAPTVIHGGTKTNVIPDQVDIQVDIRTLPGETEEDVHHHLREALGDLHPAVEIEGNDDPSTASPVDTPLWDTISSVSERLVGDSALVPFVMVGGTDNRFFRRAGSIGYGFGLFSQRLTFEDYATMFHGNDERIDQESLALCTALWEEVAKELLT
ncbi:MAG TPA: M20/M25/M40 family metallo-hydrolase [Acidimicrobiia bacterium]|nr:M20/M25/M40 family metallo-hydrolase [Acidimicrobiia bacterium]